VFLVKTGKKKYWQFNFILFPSWKRISVCNFSIFSWISIYFYFFSFAWFVIIFLDPSPSWSLLYIYIVIILRDQDGEGSRNIITIYIYKRDQDGEGSRNIITIYIYIYKLNKSVQNHEIIIIRLNRIKIISLKIFIFFKIHWKIGVKLSFANCCWCCLVVFAFGLSYVFVIIS
jgi:hypothetical protein